MKILHIYDTSGSASIMAQYQRKLGHDVKVISMKRLDKFRISRFYNSDIYTGSSLGFYYYAIKQAKYFDVLHIHSLVRIAPWLKLIYPKKKLILQFHGSDLRLFGNTKKTKSAITASDLCLLTTRDLWNFVPTEYKTSFNECLNTPDTDLFKHQHNNNNGKWLSFMETDKFLHSLSAIESLKDKEIKIIDRSMTPYSYDSMPDLLSQYEGYIDIKIQNNKPLESLSKTGLEALAMGLKVMNWKGEILTELPREHNPYHVCNELNNIITGNKPQVITQ